MTQDDLQRRVDNIVSGRSPKARAALAATRTAPGMLAADAQARPGRPFSAFIPEDVQKAVDLASEMMRIADARGGGDDGLAEAVSEVERRLSRESGPQALALDAAPGDEPIRGLAQHALKLFVTHYAPARDRLRLHTLERRQPGLLRASAQPSAADETEADPGTRPVATPPEDRVSFWREDPLINEHHEHWHLVYPTAGRPSAGGGYDLGDRHGELFAYMHEQMLARYDAERVAVNLDRVAEFEDYAAPIPQGYDPGDLLLWDGGNWSACGPRPAGAAWSDLAPPFNTRPGATIQQQETFCQRMTEAARGGTFSLLKPPLAVTIDNLGDAEEANTNSPDYQGSGGTANFQTYGNHHNDGHIHFMAWNNAEPYGVMGNTSTAVRDPIFFRWHKEVDSVYQAFQNTQAPYDFAGGPRVRIRKQQDGHGGAQSPDIQLFRLSTPGQPDLQALTAAIDAGGALPAGLEATDELRTEMRQRQVMLQDADGNPVPQTINYLSHEDFLYAFRVENLAGAPQDLAVRVFLAPESEIGDRTAWMELDRFSFALTGDTGVVVRRSEDSSVVRKPALKPADLEPTDEPSPRTELSPWCDCGWPYTLLLPRGTSSGMGFRLFVMFSDGAELSMPPQPGKCTSLSYCGLKDQNYPDKREMGFPFNRPFARPIPDTVEQQDNMGWKTIAIRCTNIPQAPAPVTVAVHPDQLAQPQPV